MRRRGRALRRRYGRADAGGDMWMVRYVHKISPSDKDVKGPVHIPGGAFSNKNTLGAALRKAGVMGSGEPVKSFRVEGDKVVVFPGGRPQIWHAIVLTHAGG